ncbi:unnamed protein product [Nezara viridula]|uniref:Neuropeptide n=1 Tax=Nezara viridula TaxID=85310 RepID=A0A9P0HNU6_NEZVI|nr:unnamed protein product [Nezara viridula]
MVRVVLIVAPGSAVLLPGVQTQAGAGKGSHEGTQIQKACTICSAQWPARLMLSLWNGDYFVHNESSSRANLS